MISIPVFMARAERSISGTICHRAKTGRPPDPSQGGRGPFVYVRVHSLGQGTACPLGDLVLIFRPRWSAGSAAGRTYVVAPPWMETVNRSGSGSVRTSGWPEPSRPRSPVSDRNTKLFPLVMMYPPRPGPTVLIRRFSLRVRLSSGRPFPRSTRSTFPITQRIGPCVCLDAFDISWPLSRWGGSPQPRVPERLAPDASCSRRCAGPRGWGQFVPRTFRSTVEQELAEHLRGKEHARS